MASSCWLDWREIKDSALDGLQMRCNNPRNLADDQVTDPVGDRRP